jgi:prepilin-type N-terminal cleavage/methylation domain-containing protein
VCAKAGTDAGIQEEKTISAEHDRLWPGERRGRGFTLIELLVVVGIMSVLGAIFVPAFDKARRRARSAESMSNVRQITAAVNLFAMDNKNRYPPSAAAVSHPDGSWNWCEPFTLTGSQMHEFLSPHRAMSEYLGEYIKDADIMFCPSVPKRPMHLQQVWNAGDAWDDPRTPGRCFRRLRGGGTRGDAMYGSYCFYWNYTGWLPETEKLFRGPSDLCGTRRQSKLLVSCYLGFGHWLNKYRYGGDPNAYGSCEHFRGANVTPERPRDFPGNSAYWSRPQTDINLDTIEIKPYAGYVDGHVESFTASEAAAMQVINRDDPRDPLQRLKGEFYLPQNGVH